jgi:hypothetical protein
MDHPGNLLEKPIVSRGLQSVLLGPDLARQNAAPRTQIGQTGDVGIIWHRPRWV